MPVSHLLRHFLPRMPTNPHLHRFIGTTRIATTYGPFNHLWKQPHPWAVKVLLVATSACTT